MCREYKRARARFVLLDIFWFFFFLAYFFLFCCGGGLSHLPNSPFLKKGREAQGRGKTFIRCPRNGNAPLPLQRRKTKTRRLCRRPLLLLRQRRSRERRAKKANDDEEDEKKNEEDKLQSPTNEKNKGEEEVARDDDDDDDEKRRQQQQQQQQQQPQAKEEKVMKSCPYLSFVNRPLLDFDFEKRCSVSLIQENCYCCLTCGHFFAGRGPKTPAYTHALERENHFVFMHLGKWQSVLSSG